MCVPLRGGLEWSHKVDGDLLKGIAFIDGYKGVSLGLRIAVPSLTGLAPVDEVFYHLLESREVEVPSDPGEGGSNSHVSSFLSVGVEKDFRGHLVGHANLGFLFS